MIGVLSKPGEAAEIREFFELFKTPWEFYRESGCYDAVIVTTETVPSLRARVILVYGPDLKQGYGQDQVAQGSQARKGVLDWNGAQIPIYGTVQTLTGQEPVLALVEQGAAAGVRVRTQNGAVYRFGYDLFGEIRHLLGEGQPAEYAHIPTLDLHIDLLRQTILKEGLPLVEIPPAPAGRDFVVCLTHDIDFIGIRDHFLDHTMWGFLYRSTLGAFRDYIRGRISVQRLARIWAAAVSLPLIYLGLKKDYWIPFDWYLKVEKGLSPTYYFIPFKNRQGEKVSVPNAERRATAYDVTDLGHWSKRLTDEGCEIGVHGIDAWHDPAKGSEELGRVNNATGQTAAGIRMHWLLRDASTYRVLEQAGYQYDSTSGYNEAVGYRNGTAQVFRPLTAETLLELPLHIQDGALFFPQKLGLSETEAWELCQGVIDRTQEHGGIVTVLWHDRSHGPERFWGEFYAKLVEDLKGKKVWFASGAQAVGWFNRRRQVSFERDHGTIRTRIPGGARSTLPPLIVRVYPAQQAQEFNGRGAEPVCPVEHHWTGERELELTTHGPTPSPSFSAADNVLAPGV